MLEVTKYWPREAELEAKVDALAQVVAELLKRDHLRAPGYWPPDPEHFDRGTDQPDVRATAEAYDYLRRCAQHGPEPLPRRREADRR